MGAEASKNGTQLDPIKRAERSSALQRVVAEYGAKLAWSITASETLPEARESVGVTITGQGEAPATGDGEALCVIGGRGTDLAEYNDVWIKHDGCAWAATKSAPRGVASFPAGPYATIVLHFRTHAET